MPDDRQIAFSVPFVVDDIAYGDVQIRYSPDGSVFVSGVDLARELDLTINDEGREALAALTGDRAFIPLEELAEIGYVLEFDLQLLQLDLVSLEPRYRAIRSLTGGGAGNDLEIDVEPPARFSSFLNLAGNFDYLSRGNEQDFDLFFDGATRFKNVVLEYEGGYTDQFEGSQRLLRRSVRAVYDQPDKQRRFSAGDLSINTQPILRTAKLGGVAVEKSAQLFSAFTTISRLSGQAIFLDNRSTVDVFVDGTLSSSRQLDAGPFDISNLPIQQGSNDIQLRIRDSFGREEIIDYKFFFQQLPIAPGDDEYSIALGLVANDLFFEPDYTSELGLSAYYRRALSTDLVLGGALQASQETQVLGVNLLAVPQFVPGLFDVEAAASTSDQGTGIAFRGSYSLSFGGLTNSTNLTFSADYESAEFETIDNLLTSDFDLLSFNASVSQSFGPQLIGTAGVTYISGRGDLEDNYNVFAEVNYRVNSQLRLSGGIEYGRTPFDGTEFGVRVSLSYAFGTRTRASADYRSRLDSFRASLSRGTNDRVGSLGYDVSVARFSENYQAAAQVDYIDNRFEVRGDVQTIGDSFGGVLDQQRFRMQIGSSLAYADGAFGIGRPIQNSFVLARPSAELDDQELLTGRDLDDGRYYARSGALGSAVQGDLSPFNTQTVQYGAADIDEPFDVGDGVSDVRPPYKSGYRIEVGNAYYLSYIGTLVDTNGPVQFATGRVVSDDSDVDFEELPFFTNSAGRFGLYGLAPGRRYRVELAQGGRTFTIEVPDNAQLITRSGQIAIPELER